MSVEVRHISCMRLGDTVDVDNRTVCAFSGKKVRVITIDPLSQGLDRFVANKMQSCPSYTISAFLQQLTVNDY